MTIVAPSQPAYLNRIFVPANAETVLKELKSYRDKLATEAPKYFEVKGDRIIFKNTDDLAVALHEGIVKLNQMAQMAVKELNSYANQARTMDPQVAISFITAKLMEVRIADPVTVQMMGLFASSHKAEIRQLTVMLLHKLAEAAQHETRHLSTAASKPAKAALRAAVWLALKENSFSLKKQEFEALRGAPTLDPALMVVPGGAAVSEIKRQNFGTRMVNWGLLNPMVAKAKKNAQPYALAGALFAPALVKVGVPDRDVELLGNILAAIAMDT